MIESAGRVADGLLGHALFTVEHIAEVVRPAIAKGAAHADRDPAEIAVSTLVISVVDDDAERARREAAAQIAFYCSAKTYAGLLDSHGFGAEGEAIRDRVRRRRPRTRWSPPSPTGDGRPHGARRDP